VFEEGLANPD